MIPCSFALLSVRLLLEVYFFLFCGSGIDDTRNIARIATKMLKDGCTMPLNDGTNLEHAVSWRPYSAKGRKATRKAVSKPTKSKYQMSTIIAAPLLGESPSVLVDASGGTVAAAPLPSLSRRERSKARAAKKAARNASSGTLGT